jgi:aminoglycoside phosphotransferase (APT) family kinase protein
MQSIEHLLSRIDAHAAATGLAPATITRKATGASHLYARLKAGRTVTLDVASRLADWLDANAPKQGAAE